MRYPKHFLLDQAGEAGGAAAGGAAATGGDAGGAAAGGAAPPAFDWKAAGVDDVGLALVSDRKWTNAGELLNSYRNLEKLTGVPPEQIVKLPKGNDPAEWGAVYDRMGRPKAPTEYKLPVPEGDSGEFATEASTWFHELGLSTSQGQKLAEKWNGKMASAQKAARESYEADVKVQGEKLKAEWGQNYQANVQAAKNAARAFGLDEATVGKLEQAMGFAGVHKFLFTVGSKLGEADFAGGEHVGGPSMTPEAARAEIARLEKDKTFAALYHSTTDMKGKAEARDRMRKLHEIAWPAA